MKPTVTWTFRTVEARELNHSKGVVLRSNDKYCTSSYAGHVKITWPIFFFIIFSFSFFIGYGLAALMYITSSEQ
jgi:hypothetical protein